MVGLTEQDNHGIGCWRIMRGGGAGIVASDVAGGTIPIVGIPICVRNRKLELKK